MIRKKFRIQNETGLHLRPAARLSTEAMKYQCSIWIRNGEIERNGKSLMSILGVGARYQDEIEVICDGSDEEKAMENVGRLIEEGLGEE
ncbi:MAG: HPr family phosphocarrier protein [Eubacteriales bacterium]|nr:HPr family phosphocarrier protein [Eubacteriales bacterium]